LIDSYWCTYLTIFSLSPSSLAYSLEMEGGESRMVEQIQWLSEKNSILKVLFLFMRVVPKIPFRMPFLHYESLIFLVSTKRTHLLLSQPPLLPPQLQPLAQPRPPDPYIRESNRTLTIIALISTILSQYHPKVWRNYRQLKQS